MEPEIQNYLSSRKEGKHQEFFELQLVKLRYRVDGKALP